MIDQKELLRQAILTINHILERYGRFLDERDLTRLRRHAEDFTRLQIQEESVSAVDALRKKGAL